ncbi:MAG: hypothetical protein HEP71_16720 [Roseivirga sp.]|nr:hypothetical protein [Roseivirga sp.]
MKNYPHLKAVLSLFREDSGLDNEQVSHFLRQAVDKGNIDKSILKEEFKEALQDVTTDWKLIAEETKLLLDPSNYSSSEIADYVKEWLWEYVYPEMRPDTPFILELRDAVLELLEQNGNDWVDAYEMLQTLRLRPKFKELEYFQLWYVDFRANDIARKEIPDKDRLIGYIRIER